MKFASLKDLSQRTVKVIKRFPFEIIFAFTGTVAAITYIELTAINLTAESWCVRLMTVSNLGLLVSLAVTLYCEDKKIKSLNLVLFKLIAALAGISLIFLIDPFKYQADFTRFFLLSLSLHLLVAYAAFLKPDHIQGFWQFNKTLFLRFLTSLLYSIVLFTGIAAAISAMNFLFNFNFEWDTYMIVWIIIIGIFNTLFFLGGIPENLQTLDQDSSYPKGLKIFTQYVLIPLATLYLIILLAYEIKILIQWSIPKGLVSKLILSYAVFGILSLLLVFPIRGKEENKWIKTYDRSFYFLMLPLIALLFLALGARIFSYGVTEYRYFLILLACWLLFITIYFLVSKKQNIKLIPISLSILTLLSIYGPQSVFSVSMHSQRKILTDFFKRNNSFEQGKLKPLDDKKISTKEGNRALNILNYLIGHYDITSLQPYLKRDLSALNDSLSNIKGTNNDRYQLKNKQLDWAKQHLGLSKFSVYGYNNKIIEIPDPKEIHYFSTNQGEIVKTKDYDFILTLDSLSKDVTVYETGYIHINTSIINDILFSIKLNDEKLSFNLKPLMTDLIKNESRLKAYIDTETNKIAVTYKLPPEMLSLTMKTEKYKVTLKLINVSFETEKKNEFKKILRIDGYYLVKVK